MLQYFQLKNIRPDYICFVVFVLSIGALNMYITFKFTIFSEHADTDNKLTVFKNRVLVKLPSARSMVNTWAKNIFFAETSEVATLDAIEACAVESAARANPDWQVNVLFISSVANWTILEKLKEIGNIKFAQMSVTKFAKRSPLKMLIFNDLSLHTNLDVVRFLILFQYGGIFLDLSVVVVRPFTSLSPNWFVKISNHYVEEEPLALSGDFLGRKFSRIAIKNLRQILYLPPEHDHRKNIGKEVVTKTLKRICSTSFVPAMTAQTCKGFQFYNNKFFPMSKKDHTLILQPHQLMLGDAYLLHLKNYRNSSPLYNVYYPRLARSYCPTTHKFYGDEPFISVIKKRDKKYS